MGQAARKFAVIEGGSSMGLLAAIEEPIGEPLVNHDGWLFGDDLATLAAVSLRMAQKALSAGRWRGVDLAVRQVAVGRGGAGGMAPQVHVDSLPADLRAAWYLGQGVALHERVDAATGEVRQVPEAVLDPRMGLRLEIAQWRLSLIRKAVSHPRGSGGRKAALEEVAAAQWVMPDGKRRLIGRSTLYGWVAGYDAQGLTGLLPEVRRDKGERRVVVSQAWDGFFGTRVCDDVADQVAGDVTKYIRSLWASGEAGWRMIAHKTTTRLIEMTRDLRDVSFDGLPLGGLSDVAGTQTQFGICAVHGRRVRAEDKYRLIAMRNKDNAKFQDTVAPTIRRDYSLLKPREIVVGDVHPMDIMVLRPDGSKAYPKAIAWFDPATAEVHMTVVLLERNEGVRREHVAMAFEAMVDQWGLPKLLYLDNGSEYSWAEMIDGFTQLSKLAGMTIKEHGAGIVDARVEEAQQAVVRSIAYNAKGKPGIEGLFGNLEQVFFSNVPGWTAGERMRKKTHAKGRDPVPFNGDMQAFYETIRIHLEHYHKRPMRGSGKSPNEVLRGHISGGWGKTVLQDPAVLALAFSTLIERTVDRGTVQFAPRHGESQRYYCAAFVGMEQGTKITLRVPAYDPEFLFVFDDLGELIGIARPEARYHPLDPAGAIEGAKRGKYLRRHIRQMSRDIALLDLTGETVRHIGHLPDAPEVPVAAEINADMLSRMADRAAAERVLLAAPEAQKRRAAKQFAAPRNAALDALEYDDEDQE